MSEGLQSADDARYVPGSLTSRSIAATVAAMAARAAGNLNSRIFEALSESYALFLIHGPPVLRAKLPPSQNDRNVSAPRSQDLEVNESIKEKSLAKV